MSLKCKTIYAVRFPVIFWSFISSHLHWLLINVDLQCDLYNRSVCQSVKRNLGASRAAGVAWFPHARCQWSAGSGITLGPAWAADHQQTEDSGLLVHSLTVEELLLNILAVLFSRKVWCLHTMTLVV